MRLYVYVCANACVLVCVCVCENRLFVCFNFVVVFLTLFALIHYYILPAQQVVNFVFNTRTHTNIYTHTYTHTYIYAQVRVLQTKVANWPNSRTTKKCVENGDVCVSVCLYMCVPICVWPLHVCLCACMYVFVRNLQKCVIAIKFRCFAFALLLLLVLLLSNIFIVFA